MRKKTVDSQTILQREEVISEAVRFFTAKEWMIQTQTAGAVTFRRENIIPWGGFATLVIGALFCLTFVGAIIGIPLAVVGIIRVVRAKHRLQWFGRNLVITVSSLKENTRVTITYDRRLGTEKLVNQFIETLSKKSNSDLLNKGN